MQTVNRERKQVYVNLLCRRRSAGREPLKEPSHGVSTQSAASTAETERDTHGKVSSAKFVIFIVAVSICISLKLNYQLEISHVGIYPSIHLSLYPSIHLSITFSFLLDMHELKHFHTLTISNFLQHLQFHKPRLSVYNHNLLQDLQKQVC